MKSLFKIRSLILSLILAASTSNAFSLPLTEAENKEYKDYYRQFVKLQNGNPEEFYKLVTEFEDFLEKHELWEAYYKVKTNDGFFSITHQNPERVLRTSLDLNRRMRANNDTLFNYLATGLKGDLLKMMRSHQADSVYREALKQVGDRDPKFKTLVHIYLAQVNYMTHPKLAIQWADLALEEAEKLDNFEYRSMALGIKCYVYFMIDDPDNFERCRLKREKVRENFMALDSVVRYYGRQRFDQSYDAVIEVAKIAFEGNFEQAILDAEKLQLNMDRQVVIFRIKGMEGNYKKEQASERMTNGFIIITCIYIFIYIMGRRRLVRKIWKREKELKLAKEKAEEASRMKSSFIRSMSHEIRTPLNAINGFSQILCTPDYPLSDEEKMDMQQRIVSSTEAITIIINELLELAAGESVTLDINDLTPVKINDVCRKAISIADEHNDKHLDISFKTELTNDYAIKSNEETISQILVKIIDNALKFTDEGSIKISVMEASHHVQISVADTGIGVPEDMHEAIFENFVKLDEFSEGIGLGLSICRRLANSLGGDVLIDSQYKKGSRFILQLPVVK